MQGPLDDERFDEIGLEVVDELGHADEDDERRESPSAVRRALTRKLWTRWRRYGRPS